MLIGIKDTAKLAGISIIACCAVFVCTLFINFKIDLTGIQDQLTTESMNIFYEAQSSTSTVVCAVSGGCLLITSVIMLMFYIKHYIDTHKKELGILKALGYSNFSIAKSFWIFGLSIFVGTGIGYGSSFLLMPSFYIQQNADKILPEYTMHFHPELAFYLVILPTAFFAALSVWYAMQKLKQPALELLREKMQTASELRHQQKQLHKLQKSENKVAAPTVNRSPEGNDTADKNRSFLSELKSTTLRSRKTLVFFIMFSSFCYSSMMQMSYSMSDLSSEMMAALMITIGIMLAFTTLLLAITTVVKGNTKTIAMMQIFGYTQKDCSKSILGCYRPMAYIGFIIGTGYQYFLINTVVTVVFKDVENIPEYSFSIPALVITLISFILIYEAFMYFYTMKIKKISIKEVMIE